MEEYWHYLGWDEAAVAEHDEMNVSMESAMRVVKSEKHVLNEFAR